VGLWGGGEGKWVGQGTVTSEYKIAMLSAQTRRKEWYAVCRCVEIPVRGGNAEVWERGTSTNATRIRVPPFASG